MLRWRLRPSVRRDLSALGILALLTTSQAIQFTSLLKPAKNISYFFSVSERKNVRQLQAGQPEAWSPEERYWVSSLFKRLILCGDFRRIFAGINFLIITFHSLEDVGGD